MLEFRAFRDAEDYFGDVLAKFRSSDDDVYRHVPNNLRHLLLVGDRVCCALSGEPDVSRAVKRTQSALDSKNLSVGHIEGWLKALWRLASPTDYEKRKRKNERCFNLHQVLKDTGLISNHDISLNLGHESEISDPVRRAIFLGYADRNLDEHEDAEIPHEILYRMPIEAKTTVLASLALLRHKLEPKLLGLISRPLHPVVQSMAAMAGSENNTHAKRFHGRSNSRGPVVDHLTGIEPSQGPLLVLYGHEGSGKSALAAKVSRDLQPESPALGSAAQDVQSIAPWLPGSLLHTGKVGSDPTRIVCSLIGQANTMLVDAAQLPTDAVAVKGDRKKLHEELRASLNAALSQLVRERGSASVILDALDEMDPDNRGLAFLPSPLPEGVRVLVTTRQCAALSVLQGRYPDAELRELDGIDRGDLPGLTHVSDDVPGGEPFNDRVFQETQGLAFRVRNVGLEVERNDGNFAGVQTRRDDTVFFSNQLTAWDDAHIPDWMLALLVVAAPAPALRLEAIQRFHRHSMQEPDISLRQLRRMLGPVSDQLQGLDVVRAKLSHRAFADYYWTQQLGQEDGPSFLRDVVEWLATDPKCEADFVLGFLRYWGAVGQQEVAAKEAVATIAQLFAEAQRYDVALGVVLPLFDTDAVEVAVAIAEALAFGTNPDELSPRDLFSLQSVVAIAAAHLLNPQDPLADTNRGRRLIEQGIALGHTGLAVDLGERLLGGYGLPRDAAAGVRLLEHAIDAGNADAMTLLGQRLVLADGVPMDRARGLELMESALEVDISAAEPFRRLAECLLRAPCAPADEARAIEMLKAAIERRDTDAMCLLADRLLDASRPEHDEEEGWNLLENAADAGSVRARFAMAERLLHGRGVTPDPEQGMRLLELAARDDHPDALRELARRLSEGCGIEPDASLADELLRRAVEIERIPAHCRYFSMPEMPALDLPGFPLVLTPPSV